MEDHQTFQVEREGWHYTIVENGVLDDLELSKDSRLLYVYLSKYAGNQKQCWPSVKTLAMVSGISERQVRYCLNQLEAKGYIVKRTRRDGQRNLSNVYKLKYIPSKVKEIETEPREEPVIGDTAHGAGGVLQDMQGGAAQGAAELKSFNQNHIELESTTETKAGSAETAAVLSPESKESKLKRLEDKNRQWFGRMFPKPSEIQAMETALAITKGDVDFIEQVGDAVIANYKPKFEGDRITSFKYILSVLREAWAAKQARAAPNINQGSGPASGNQEQNQALKNEIINLLPEEFLKEVTTNSG